MMTLCEEGDAEQNKTRGGDQVSVIRVFTGQEFYLEDRMNQTGGEEESRSVWATQSLTA